MAASSVSQNPVEAKTNDEGQIETRKAFMEFSSSIPKRKGWLSEHLYQYQGSWYTKPKFEGLVSLQNHFKPQPTTVLLVSNPKSGTTWFKALLFALMNRTGQYEDNSHPLLTKSPHECVPFLESYAYDNPTTPYPDLPLLATHVPYASLPESLLTSDCRIVYVFRDPKDVFVSLWHFAGKRRPKKLPSLLLDEAFEMFCEGVSPYGPFWDHVLAYQKASLECPERVLILQYEEMTRDPIVHAKRLAAFIGHPFSLEEERQGVIQRIVDMCSFEKLSSLEVNKSGVHHGGTPVAVQNSSYFREGKVGDYKNLLTAEMIQRLDKITKDKFGKSGLSMNGLLDDYYHSTK
ncbi:Sulfotransferase domain [Dillenia turbinata]|uniref:Sulfotransferase n=1 Tax=Dillenia turbinata TaxID=194707 RepID=A0AAN8V432_9MAGN